MGVFERAPPASRIDLAEEPEFIVGGLKVVPAELAVSSGSERELLQPRVMKVLVALARASPAVVSRDRLVDQCWDGRIVGDDALNRCVLALRQLAQRLDPQPFSIETVPRVGHRLLATGAPVATGTTQLIDRWPRRLLAAALIAALVLAALLLRPWSAGPPTSTVLVAAGQADPESRELAADLVVKLGSLETAQPTYRLISDLNTSPENADLMLEVGRVIGPGAVGANLALKSGPDRSILWSRELRQPSGNLADLKQQIAFMAGRVLGCAAEASNSGGQRLDRRTLQLYLNGCAALADLYGREVETVIPMFRDVLRNAPRFEGAWAKLLLADSDAYSDTLFGSTEFIRTKSRLTEDLAAARKVNPNLPDAYLAEAAMLPIDAHAERLRLIDRAIEIEPGHPAAYHARAKHLQLVGRMKDSVMDARHARQLDPISPLARGEYAYALAAAGENEAAIEELAEAERLWPGSSGVTEAKFAVNLRFGDPVQALEYVRRNPSADRMNAGSYLEARADRSPAKIERAIREAEIRYKRRPGALQHLIQVYGEFDRNEQLLEVLEKAPPELLVGLIDLTFRAPTVDFWLDPRALRIAKRAGLLDYWRNSGEWPDFCFRADLSYDCRIEAQKITR